jgi:hypothetical protein
MALINCETELFHFLTGSHTSYRHVPAMKSWDARMVVEAFDGDLSKYFDYIIEGNGLVSGSSEEGVHDE